MNHSINSQTYLSKLERTVQDHYQTLEKTLKNKNGKKTGKVGSIQKSQNFDFALADFIERFEEAQKIH